MPSELGSGKPRPHTKKVIRERREQILLLMSRGYSQGDISRELNVTRQTISIMNASKQSLRMLQKNKMVSLLI